MCTQRDGRRLLWQRRFSLRALMLLVTGVAVVSWACAHERRNAKKYQALEAIWALGGSTCESGERILYQPTSNLDWVVARPHGWLPMFFSSLNVEVVVFRSNSAVNDDDALRLASYVRTLSTVRGIWFYGSPISKGAAKKLQRAVPDCTVHFINGPIPMANAHAEGSVSDL